MPITTQLTTTRQNGIMLVEIMGIGRKPLKWWQKLVGRNDTCIASKGLHSPSCLDRSSFSHSDSVCWRKALAVARENSTTLGCKMGCSLFLESAEDSVSLLTRSTKMVYLTILTLTWLKSCYTIIYFGDTRG